MVDETRPGMFERGPDVPTSPAESPSRAAALGTLLCSVAIAVGVLGQIISANGDTYGMITALGLACLATIVLAHERKRG
jgi:hypothetical protein